MRKIIDNEPKSQTLERYTLKDALKEYIENLKPDTLDIATGFFNLKAWELLGNQLLTLNSCRILLGWEYRSAKNTEREIQEAFLQMLDEIPITEYKQNRAHISSLIAFLEKKKPNWDTFPENIKSSKPEVQYINQLRIHPSPRLHGKMYLFPNIAIVGSSNFTNGGLLGNTELNISIDDEDSLKHLKDWFEHFFNSRKTYDYRCKLVDLLQNSKFGNKEYDPFIVFLKIVFEYHKYELQRTLEHEDEIVRLAEFQREGVSRALDIIEEFGGVLIADAVGLGKSYIGIALLRTLSLRAPPMNNDILIVCPAQLQDMWHDLLIDSGFNSFTIYSQEMMSRQAIERRAFDFILVDESHNFRNPKPKRYKNFLSILARKDPKIILLTATPINIGYMDLYHQLKLIFKNKDTALNDSLNIPDLKEFFKNIDKESSGDDINLITDHLIVARSRSIIRYRQKVLKQDILLPDGRKIEFPDRELDTIYYQIINEQLILKQICDGLSCQMVRDLFNSRLIEKPNELKSEEERVDIPETPSNILYECIFELLRGWEATPFSIEKFKLEQYQDAEVIRSSKSIVPLLTTTLLKRLESSVFCFIRSVKNLILFYKISDIAVQKGFHIKSKIIKQFIDFFDEKIDEDIDPFDLLEVSLVEYDNQVDQTLKSLKTQGKIEDLDLVHFQKEFKNQFSEALNEEVEILNDILEIMEKILNNNDFKLLELKIKLKLIINDAADYKEKKTVIFSFFEDTASYIYESILKDKEYLSDLNNPKIEIISGKVNSRKKRKEIIDRFAPISSSKDIPKEEQIDILISTDVLSEGQNLQDAKHVINYDLHWNPVRMIQRAGRIDRLGSCHEKIFIHNFFLEEGLEALLNLMKRIYLRLRKIDAAIELDAPVLESDLEYQNLKRIKEQDTDIIEEYENKLEFIGLNQSKKDLLTAIKEIGIKMFDRLPNGIFSGMLTSDRSGLVVAIEVTQKGIKRPSTYWCYEPDDFNKEFPGLQSESGIITAKHVVEKIMRCVRETLRNIFETPEEIYERTASIVKKLEEKLRQKDTASKMIKKIEKGNKKYYDIMNKGKKLWGVEPKVVERFLRFLSESKLDNIKRDIEVPLKNLNEELEKIKEAAEHVPDDSMFNEWRQESIERFLDEVYLYFDQHEIMTGKQDESKILGSKALKLIGIIRLYTYESMEKLKK